MTKRPKTWAQHLLEVVAPSKTEIVDDSQHAVVFLPESNQLEEAIFQDTVQLAVWRRTSLPKFVQTLSSLDLNQSKLPSFLGIVTPDTCKELLRKELLCEDADSALSRNEMEELIGDIQHLVSIFGAIISDDEIDEHEGHAKESPPPPEVHVRLECLSNDGCVYWHQDTVPLRLVTTYRGPCTEFVDPIFKEETLLNRKIDSIHSQYLTHHDVAIFKGRYFLGNIDEQEDTSTAEQQSQEHNNKESEDEDEDDTPEMTSPGIVHRSPRIEGSDVVRLVLVLDIPTEIHFNDVPGNDDDRDSDNNE